MKLFLTLLLRLEKPQNQTPFQTNPNKQETKVMHPLLQLLYSGDAYFHNENPIPLPSSLPTGSGNLIGFQWSFDT